MNIVFTYLKAHLAKDTTAAVDLADYHPSFKNLSFARKILNIKLTTAECNFCYKEKDKELNINKAIKYKKLLGKLAGIEQRKTYQDKDIRHKGFETLKKFHYEFSKRNMDFSNYELSDVDLSSYFLEGSKFTNSDLSGTKIKANDADFSNAKLDDAQIKFKNIKYMDRACVGGKIIDDPAKKAILNTLRSIDDKYSDIKINLVKELIKAVHYWDKNYVNVQHIDSFLDYIFSKEYYLEDKEIRDSVKSLLDQLTITNNNKKHIALKHVSLYLDIISKFFNDQEQDDFLLKNNKKFINLMAVALYHKELDIQEKSRTLYDKYLKLERVRSFYEKHKTVNDEKVDWDNKDANNIIIINENKTMVTSYNELNKMLFADIKKADTQWNSFFLYINEKRQEVNKINNGVLFNDDFKIFKENYSVFALTEKFNKLASKFGDYAEKFYSAFVGNPIQFEDKLSDIHNNENVKIYSVLDELIDRQKSNLFMTSLKNEHYQQICDIFELNGLADSEKSNYLLCLAIIFVKYASNDVFGIGNVSPLSLKLYAYALVRKANELNKNLMGNHYYEFISDLLTNGHETTGLFFQMRAYGEQYCGSVFNKMIPPQWR
ncbi:MULTISPECIES: pentapeptide repeat-containing protein [Proteus]|uniref:E3 ubiquitin-protein ligase SopA-like catalytic domain-containing protein n=1 Tax=Proteus columbae TaxID=1987580 RepID=A0A6I7DBH4_9GAMM|nr:pentapeptide repeat-containing protein [Proteus columbae]MBG2801119.1 hypothetical protein [Proteus mirabilis]QHN10820.1 hypothetical protein F1325_10230 [Proteus columbae]